MILRTVLASRNYGMYLGAAAALCALSLALGDTGVVFNFEIRRAAVRLPFPEISAVLAGAAGAVLLRPRFWEWDKVATARASVAAGACAMVGSAVPMLVVAIGAARLPDDAAVGWRLSNAVVLGAVIFIASPFVGSAVAGAGAVLCYFLHGLTNNLWLDLAFLPITRFPNTQTHWVEALSLVLMAAVVHYRTLGATPWSQRIFARDD